MFEAQSKSRPKLVYAHAGSNDINRDQVGDMSSYVRNLVARIAQEDVNNQEPLQQKQQLTEIGTRVLQSKQGHETNHAGDKHKYLQREQPCQLKQIDVGYVVANKRPIDNDISVRGENVPVSMTRRVEDTVKESNKRYLQPSAGLNDKLKSQPNEILQLRATEGSSTNSTDKLAVGKKLETVSLLSSRAATEVVKSAVSQSTAISAQRIETVSLLSTAADKATSAASPSSAQPAEKVALGVSLSSAASAERRSTASSPPTTTNVEKMVMLLSHSKAAEKTTPAPSFATAERVISISTAPATERQEAASSLSKTTTVEKSTKLGAESPDNESHVHSNSIDTGHVSSVTHSGLFGDCITTPKHIYSSSSTPTNNGQVKQKNPVDQQEAQVLLQSQRQVIQNYPQQNQDTKVHATTIKIHSYPQQRQQTLAFPGQTGISDISLNSSSSTPISNKFKSLAMQPSHRFSERSSPIECDPHPERLSAHSSSAMCSSSPPKSILKNTTNFDKGDTLLISGNHNEESADYFDFSSQKAAKNDSLSVKKQVHSFFKTKISSPPPQLKRHVTGDISTTISELTKEGKVPKKCVTFNSEVRLHLDNEESTVESLTVDG